jgi:hypothetical protein
MSVVTGLPVPDSSGAVRCGLSHLLSALKARPGVLPGLAVPHPAAGLRMGHVEATWGSTAGCGVSGLIRHAGLVAGSGQRSVRTAAAGARRYISEPRPLAVDLGQGSIPQRHSRHFTRQCSYG